MCKQRLTHLPEKLQRDCKSWGEREGIRQDGCRAVFNSCGAGTISFPSKSPVPGPVPGKGEMQCLTCVYTRNKQMNTSIAKKSGNERERERELYFPSNSSSLPLEHWFSIWGAHWNIWGSRAERHPVKYIKTKMSCFPARCQALCFSLCTHLSHHPAQP